MMPALKSVMQPAPVAQAAATAQNANTEALRRSGKTALIASGSQGVLGSAKTGRSQLLGN